MRKKIIACLIWIGVWEIVALALKSEILLPSPHIVIVRTLELIATLDFWKTIWISFSHIGLGLLFGIAIGVILGYLAYKIKFIKDILAPPVSVMRSVPVASFIILLLAWVSSVWLAIPICFIIVFPLVYTNIFNGLNSLDKSYTEMADIFRIDNFRKIRYVIFPQMSPFIKTAFTASVGLAWKSGIAAEVIGMSKGSIGEHLQQAKVFLMMRDLFAWTLVIVLLSIVMEKLVLLVLRKIEVQLSKEPKVSIYSSETISTTDKNITIKNLYKKYGEKQVLEDFSLEIPEGGLTCIYKPSGYGKTTLLNILMNLTKYDSGEIEGLEGKEISVVFQEDRLIPSLSVVTNIMIANPGTSRSDVESALSSLGLFSSKDLKADSLSGGMKRRVALLRCLLHTADLYLLDEPFKGLDKDIKKTVMEYTVSVLRNKTVVLITHDNDEKEYMESKFNYHYDINRN